MVNALLPQTPFSLMTSQLIGDNLDESHVVPQSFEDGGCAKLLPPDFIPSAFDAVLGRGKVYIDHAGNGHLRAVVLAALPAYAAAKSRIDKSSIISKVVHQVRSMSPTGTGFVKFDVVANRWFDCSEYLGRERVGQLFRDVLSNRYKSSSLFKKTRRDKSKSNTPRGGSVTSESTASDSNWDGEESGTSENQASGQAIAVGDINVPSGGVPKTSFLSPIMDAFAVVDFNPSDDPYEPKPILEALFPIV